MSYLTFHLVFILPPILLLAWLYRRGGRRIHPHAGLFLLLITVIALVYTTPWDNYLVWRGVWGYGEDRVLGTIGYVPIEEYLFFVLQPLLAGLWLYLLLSGGPRPESLQRTGRTPGEAIPDETLARFAAARPVRHPLAVRLAGAAGYLLLAVLGAILLGSESGTYLGLILAWACPVLAAQWAYAGPAIHARGRTFALGVGAPTLYLWGADATAIQLGIWEISERYTLGPALGPLPLEEAVFFLVTNLLVVQGLLLFLYPPGERADSPQIAASRGRTAPA